MCTAEIYNFWNGWDSYSLYD